MPSPLKHFGIDPNKKGRGSGLYYLRGQGVYSKYDYHRDEKIVAKGYDIHKIGQPTKSKIRHSSDGNLPW